MRMLKEIQIKNYRGIKDISFASNSINLIIGPNNTGKSSILEAIALAITSGRDFTDTVDSDLFEYLFELKTYSPDYIVHINENTSEIQVSLGEKSYAMTIEYYPTGLPDDERYGMIMEYFEDYARRVYTKYIEKVLNREYSLLKDVLDYFIETSLKYGIDTNKVTLLKRDLIKYLYQDFRGYREYEKMNNLNENQKLIERIIDDISTQVLSSSKILITTYNTNREIVRLHLYMTEPVRLRAYPRSSRYYAPTLYLKGIYKIVDSSVEIPHFFNVVFNFQKSALASNVGNLYDLVVSKGRIGDAINILKERIPYVKDIRKTEQGMYVIVSHHNTPIPLSSMGDGFITLLKLSFLIALLERGIIILEEPEVSLHPYFMEIVAEEIVTNSKNVQFFISTHSLDLLNALLEKAEEENKLHDVNVVRLHYREDTKNVYAEVLSGVDAKDEIDEIGTDLRYT